MENRKMDKKDIIYLVIYSLTFVLGIPNRILVNLNIDIPSYAWVFILYSVAALLGLILYRKEFIYEFSQIKGRTKKGIKLAIKAIIAIWIMNMFMFFLMNNITDFITTTNQSAIYEVLKENSILMFLPMIVFGPFVEELVFRHIIIGKFSSIFPKLLMMIVSVVVFAYLHTGFKTEIIVYMPITLVLTYLYIKTKENFAATFLFHMSWNFLGFFASLLIIKMENFLNIYMN